MMMRRILVLVLLMILVVSCRKESPFATLSGSVYYYGIAIPIRGVSVKVDQNFTYSGAGGSYTIPEIRKGIYTLRADKEGFETYNFEMKFMEDLVFHNIQMVSMELTSMIYGDVYGDYSGEPRPGLWCVLMNPNGTESRLGSLTDSVGYYGISMVPEGYHLLKVMDEEEVVFQEWLEVGADNLEYDIVLTDVFTFEDKRDGKEYTALKIGSLSWMTANLAYLPYVNQTDNISSTDRLYYVYGYEGRDPGEAEMAEYYKKYGALYNYKAAITACPEGWRLPTDEDWKSLERYLGMDNVGIRLKDSLGWAEGGNGDNSSWFSALPGGYNGYTGGFFGEGYFAGFWTSTKCGDDAAWHRYLKADEDGVFRLCNYMRHGYSVRCVRK